MILVDYRPKEESRSVYEISLNGSLWLEVHPLIFGRQNPIFQVTYESMQEWDSTFLEEEYRQALRFALKRLSIKNQTSNNLKKSLQDKLIRESTIEHVLLECKRLNFLNDEAWVDYFITQQISRRMGPRMIIQKLRTKGIPHQIATTAVNQRIHEETQQEQIQYLLSTRYKRYALNNPIIQRKVILSLIRKGFSLTIIQDQLKMLKKEVL